MKKVILYIFALVSLGELAAIFFLLAYLQLIFKPLIMVVLGIFYFSSLSSENRSVSVLAAIFFSLAGDMLLIFQQENNLYFMLGLSAFLIAHIFYILAYRQHKFQNSEDALHGVQRIRFAFPIILAATGLLVVLFPVLGDLKFPVTIYTVVLIVMVLNALFRFGHTTAKSFWFVFAGAVLFFISDSVLAINKFLDAINNGELFIMASYMLAQYLIVSGLVLHIKKYTR